MSLLAPLATYNLALKALGVGLGEEAPGPLGMLGLLRSDLLFNLGYAALWAGVFAAARRGAPRRVAVVLLHAVTALVVAVTTSAYQYYGATGSTLDYGVVAYSLSTLGELGGAVASEAPPYIWVVLLVAIGYAILGPRIVTSAVYRTTRREANGGTRGPGRTGASTMSSVGIALAAAALFYLSLLPGAEDTNKLLARAPFVNLVVTGVANAAADELAAGEIPSRVESPLSEVSLAETPSTEKRNVVFVSLESTRARSVTPYNEDIATTPFLDELSEKSLMVERAYTIIPHTSKALTALNCGINPNTDTDITEAQPGGIPARCLPELLGEQGYGTAYFQSATGKFENRRQLVENMGYEDYTALEQMDKEGFERANYLGYEDNIMLEPSREWLGENGDEPFFTMYDTITPHHEYLAPDRYGIKDFAEDEQLNGYLNGVRYVDFFLKNLFEQYKEMGEYEDTIFVIFGDHGEGFGEHGVSGHDNVIHEEGLRTPMIVHDPSRWENGERVERPANQLDVPPTVLGLLGYEAEGGEYPGSPLYDLPANRPLQASCRPDLRCMASIEGDEKYIYHFDQKPEEFYDLSEDPLEKDNLAEEVDPKELERRRSQLLEWRARVRNMYDTEVPETQ